MERNNYYGRPSYDAPSSSAGEPITLNDKVSHILFDVGDSGLRSLGLIPNKVSKWAEKISRGEIPFGASIYEFEEMVLAMIGPRRTRG